MRAYDIILKKRDGYKLTPEEIEFMVAGHTSGSIPDSQMTAWLMSIFFQGMDADETTALTISMVESGDTLDLSSISGIKVDKHSTGGVGDKTTLVLIPLLAAAGIPMVKMAGRSLGYTGGTIDKLESIPGFNTNLSSEQVVKQVNDIGAAITAQTADLVPADKMIYALRDLTAAIESIPLIASSIMSKKIAAGADAFVLDVKVGSGAFMKNIDDAEKLAQTMAAIGNNAGKRTAALVTDMDQPLGFAVGNTLEVMEAIDTLKGDGPADLTQLCTELGSAALILAGKTDSYDNGREQMQNLMHTGKGLKKFRELIIAQNGNPNVIDDPSLLAQAPVIVKAVSSKSGYIKQLDALTIAKAEAALGGSRGRADGSLDPLVGVKLVKKRGEKVENGSLLSYVYASNDESAEQAVNIIQSAYEITAVKPQEIKLVKSVVGL